MTIMLVNICTAIMMLINDKWSLRRRMPPGGIQTKMLIMRRMLIMDQIDHVAGENICFNRVMFDVQAELAELQRRLDQL